MTRININVKLNAKTKRLSSAAKNTIISNRQDSLESKSAQKQVKKEVAKKTNSKASNASTALTTLTSTSSASKTKTPLINTRPYVPAKKKASAFVNLLTQLRGGFVVVPGGTWGYEGVYGLNNRVIWPPADGYNVTVRTKINTAPRRDTGVFLYALLSNSFLRYTVYLETNYDVLATTTTVVQNVTEDFDVTPLYSESEGAFIGRVTNYEARKKGNSLPFLDTPGNTMTADTSWYYSKIQLGFVTSAAPPPDIAQRDWGPDPRETGDLNDYWPDLFTPFQKYRPTQNAIVNGRTFECLCWLSNTNISYLAPNEGIQFLQGQAFYNQYARHEFNISWASIAFRLNALGPMWTYINPPQPELVLYKTNFASFTLVSEITAGTGETPISEGSRDDDYMRPGWNHIAVVVSQQEARAYLNGQKLVSLAQPYNHLSTEDYNKLVANMGFARIDLYNAGYGDATISSTTGEYGNPPYYFDYNSGVDYNQVQGPVKIKGIRYTERPLYVGDSFDPPSEILGPA